MNASRLVLTSGSNLEINRDVQDKLYTNIALLNLSHEPSAEFKTFFKKDMFVRSNKGAFLHVVHYLLTVLNPEMAKEKLVTWPTCNVINRENKFRKEVVQYLSELNKIYEDADLPVMMSSHLLAPGGHRFNYFIYKLSQLVLLEDLKREYPIEILHRPKPSKSEEFNDKLHQNLTKCIEEINVETKRVIDKFYRSFEMFKKEAQTTTSEKCDVQLELKEIEMQIEVEEARLKDRKLSDKEVTEKVMEMQEKFKTIEKIGNTYSECKKFISVLKENSNEGEPIDLVEALKVTNISLRRQLSELPDYEIPELESYLETLEKRKEELEQIEKFLRIRPESLLEAMNHSEDILKTIIKEVDEEQFSLPGKHEQDFPCNISNTIVLKCVK